MAELPDTIHSLRAELEAERAFSASMVRALDDAEASLAECAAILEALHASAGREMAPSIKAAIHDALPSARHVLGIEVQG